MKGKSLALLLATMAASSILFSSYIGSFGLINKLLTWNRSIGSKLVSELVFIVFWIVLVYEISILANVLVVNSIEFQSGSNPVADVGNVKTIDGKDGVYTVETKVDGHYIRKEDDEKVVDPTFNEADQSWNVEASRESVKLLKFDDGDGAVMYLPDGKKMSVELNQASALASQQVVDGYSYHATK